MSLKQTVSLFLIVSQLGSLTAMAAPAATTTIARTPEFSLLEKMYSLQGQDPTSDSTKTQVKSALVEYSATAQVEGQSERLQKALTDLRAYTPEQAATFVTDAQIAGQTDANHFSTAIQQLAMNHPMGAQFNNACGLGARLFFPAFAITVADIWLVGDGNLYYDEHPVAFDVAVVGGAIAVVGAVLMMAECR